MSHKRVSMSCIVHYESQTSHKAMSQVTCPRTSAKINFSYSILSHLTTSYSSYFEGKKGISRNKTSFFLLMEYNTSAPCLQDGQRTLQQHLLQWPGPGVLTHALS